MNNSSFDIATISTFNYFPFLLSFLGSFDKNVLNPQVEKIHILSDHMPEPLMAGLRIHERIALEVDSERPDDFSGVHGEGWRKAVARKLLFVKKKLIETKKPILLLDCDMIFLRDIPINFFKRGDVIFTYIDDERRRHVRADGIPINFIASAVFFGDIEVSILLIDKWINIMSEISVSHPPPYETPSLNLMLNDIFYRSDEKYLNIRSFNESFIASDQCDAGDSILVHLKSWGPTISDPGKNYWSRVSFNFWPKGKFAPEYMNYDLYEEWLVYALKYKK